jgi:tape measure domain-containing protein
VTETAGSVEVEVRANLARLAQGLAQARQHARQFDADAARSFGNTQRSLDRLSEGLGRTTGLIRNLALAVGGIKLAEKFVELLDTTNRLEQRLTVITHSAREAADAQAAIFEIAQKAGAPLEATTQLYTRMAIATRELGVNQDQLKRVTDIVTEAIATSGATTTEAAQGVIQFTQALALGRFQGQDLKAVLEDIPGLGISIAAGLQKVAPELKATSGNLRQLGSDGKLTSDLILRALLAMGGQIDETFSKVPQTVAQAWQNVRNELLRSIDKADDATNATKSLRGELQGLADFIASSQFVDALEGLITLFERLAHNPATQWLGGVIQGLQQLGPVAGRTTNELRAELESRQKILDAPHRGTSVLGMEFGAGGLGGLPDTDPARARMLAETREIETELAKREDAYQRAGHEFSEYQNRLADSSNIHHPPIAPSEEELKKLAAFAQRLKDVRGELAATKTLADAWGVSSEAAITGQRDADLAKMRAGLPKDLKPGQRAQLEGVGVQTYDEQQRVKQNETVTRQRELNVLTEAYLADLASGRLTVDDLADAQQLYNERITVGAHSESEFARTYGEALVKARDLARTLEHLATVRDQTNELEQLQLEVQYVGRSTAAYNVQLAVLRQIQDLKARGLTDPTDPRYRQEVNNARAVAETRNQVDRLNQGYQELEQLGESAFDNMAQALAQFGQQSGSVADTFKNVWVSALSQVYAALIKLTLVNPLLNTLFPDKHRSTLEDVLGGVGGLFSGGGGFEGFSNSVLAPGGGFQSGFDLGGLAGGAGFVLHGGGEVGRAGAPRFVHPSYFDDAPRFHAGARLMADEVPAILQRGEVVLPKGYRDAGGHGSGYVVNVIDQRGADAPPIEQRQERGPDGQMQLTLIVRAEVRKLLAGGDLDSDQRRAYGTRRQPERLG